MMTITLRTILTTLMLAVLCLTAGCGSSAVYHYDMDTVWRVAVGQSIIWRPDVIDDKNYEISATKQDPAGNEIRYQLKVRSVRNPFTSRPSTMVNVYIRRTKPRYVRFKQLERDFLVNLAEELRFEQSRPLPRR